MDDASARVVIRGFGEILPLLQSGQIGAVVNASEPDITEYRRGTEDYAIAQSILAHTETAQISNLNSGIFHFDEVKSWRRRNHIVVPDDWSLEQEIDHTLKTANAWLEAINPKKLLIYCTEGRDRSAMLKLLLMIRRDGGVEHIDELLTALVRDRHTARLFIMPHTFKGYMGKDYPVFAEAVMAFAGVAATRSKLIDEYGLHFLPGQMAGSFNLNVGHLSQQARTHIEEMLEGQADIARRFSFPAITLTV